MGRDSKGLLLPSALMAVAGAVTAAATAEWWLAPVGLAAAGLFWVLRPRASSELPSGLDAAHRFRAQRLLETRDRLMGELDSAPAVVKETLAVSAIRVRDLSQKFLRLVAKHQEIEGFLRSEADRQGVLEREQLRRQMESAVDAIARDRFRAALAAKDAQLKSRDELRRGLDRLDGELATIQASLDNVIVQLVRMKSAEARGSFESESGQVEKTLGALTSEIDTVAETLESVYSSESRQRIG